MENGTIKSAHGGHGRINVKRVHIPGSQAVKSSLINPRRFFVNNIGGSRWRLIVHSRGPAVAAKTSNTLNTEN